MTKEDLLGIRAALDKASNWAQNQPDLFQMIDARKKVEAMLNEPSLPSNLDEAAIQAHIRLEDGEGLSFLNIFKAGAQWMAGQGETHELTVESPVIGPPMICCPVKGAVNGDKVIVNIRKK